MYGMKPRRKKGACPLGQGIDDSFSCGKWILEKAPKVGVVGPYSHHTELGLVIFKPVNFSKQLVKMRASRQTPLPAVPWSDRN